MIIATLFKKAIRYQIFSVFAVIFFSFASILGSINSPFSKVMIPLILIGLILTLTHYLGWQILNGASIRKEKERKDTSGGNEIEQLNQDDYRYIKSHLQSIKAMNGELKALKKDEANQNLFIELKREQSFFNDELASKK